MAIIEAAAQEDGPATVAEILAEVRRLGLQTPSEATAIVRADRDGRYSAFAQNGIARNAILRE